MKYHRLLCCTALCCLISFTAVRAESRAPIIKHRPVSSAAMDQSLNIRAQVTSPAQPLENVTLHFTTSTDSTPVKIPMKPLDETIWSGTIPASFISGYSSNNYYIDATTTDGLITENDWYRINILSLDAAASSAIQPSSGSAGSPHHEKAWVKPALIAGGTVAVAGGAVLLLAGGGGGGGGGGSDEPATNAAGTYAGSATTCYATSTNTTCETTMIAITVSSDGYATSDTLCPDQFMRSPVDGDAFTMIAETETGQLIYSGTILADRIVGSINGSGKPAYGSGAYSGTFNATRQ